MVYKNLDISGLFGMLDARRLATVAVEPGCWLLQHVWLEVWQELYNVKRYPCGGTLGNLKQIQAVQGRCTIGNPELRKNGR